MDHYETLRTAILYEQKYQTLEGIILLRHGMLRWCYEREKILNEHALPQNKDKSTHVIKESDTKPLINVVVNMIHHIYNGENQYGQYA